MPNGERISSLRLRFEVEKAAVAQSLGQVKLLQRQVARFEQDLLNSAKASKVLDGDMKRLNSSRLLQIAENSKAAETKTRSLAEEMKNLREEVNKTAEAEDKRQRQRSSGSGNGNKLGAREAVGDVSTSLGSLASVANVGGQSAFGEILAFGGDLAGAFEYLPNLRAAVTAFGPQMLVMGAAIGVATLAVADLNRRGKEITAGVRAINERERQFYELRIAGTTDSIQAAVAAAKFEQQLAQARVDDLAYVAQGYSETAEQLGVLTGAVIELGGALQVGGLEDIRDARALYDEADKALIKANANLALYNGLLTETSTATNDATESLLKSASSRGDMERRLAEEMNYTSQQAQDRLQALNDERTALAAEQRVLEASGDTSEKVTARTEELATQISQLTDEESRLLRILPTVIDAREHEAKIMAEQVEQNKELAAATQRYNDDISKIESTTAERRADIQKKLADTLVGIAEAAAEKEEGILQKLTDERVKLATTLQRAEADATAKARFDALNNLIALQQSEAKSAREHARKLADIRRQSEQDEAEAADSRDFARLFDIRRNTTRQLQEANRAERDRQIEARIAFNEQADERTRQFAFEREQRLQKYNQDLADAAEQARRELVLNEANRRAALSKAQQAAVQEQNLLNQKYNNELAARRRAIEAELKLIAQGATARLQIEAQVQAALIKQAQQILSGGIAGGGNKVAMPGKSVPTFANGGFLGAGRPGVVNDKFPGQRETFNGQSLPNGLGIFIPSRGGTVSPGNSTSLTLNMPVNIQAGSATQGGAIGKEVVRAVEDVLREYFL